jgi:RNA polymerase sigma-70 factor (ECF subfamily)
MPAPELAPEVRGAPTVARTFAGTAAAAQPALVDGSPGLAWAPGGNMWAVFRFSIEGGRIVGIDLIVDPESIGRLKVELTGD